MYISVNLFRKISLSTCLRVCRFSIRTNKIYPSIHDGPKWATDSRPDLLDNTYIYIILEFTFACYYSFSNLFHSVPLMVGLYSAIYYSPKKKKNV